MTLYGNPIYGRVALVNLGMGTFFAVTGYGHPLHLVLAMVAVGNYLLAIHYAEISERKDHLETIWQNWKRVEEGI